MPFFAVTLAGAALAGPALTPGQATAPLSRGDLVGAELELTLPADADATVTVGGAACPAVRVATKLTVALANDSSCHGVLARTGSLSVTQGANTWTLSVPAVSGTTVDLTYDVDDTTFPLFQGNDAFRGLAGQTAYALVGARWVAVTVSGGEASGADLTKTDALVVESGGSATEYSIVEREVSVPRGSATTDALTLSRLCGALAPSGMRTECVDTTGQHAPQPTSGILAPNEELTLYVIVRKGQQVEFTVKGVPRGLSEGQVYDGSGSEGVAQFAEEGDTPPLHVAKHRLVPRLPGVFDVIVDVYQDVDGTRKKIHTQVLEYVVGQRYSAAIRLGVAAVFAPPDPTYAVATAPGSKQAEVVATSMSRGWPEALELVLGLAPFLGKGRSYYVGDRPRVQFAPYVGLGVVEATPGDALTVLRSLYLGAEAELGKGTSLALTAVVRRTRTLSDLYVVGGPIDAGVTDVPTRAGFAPGVALVVNFSPEFLNVARQTTGGAR